MCVWGRSVGEVRRMHSSDSRVFDSPQSREGHPSAHPGESLTEGHGSALNSQLMSLHVATLMLFRQLSFTAQTVNCSRLNRLLFDKSRLPQISSSPNRATIVLCSAIINQVVNWSITTYIDTRKKEKGEREKGTERMLGHIAQTLKGRNH